MGDSVDAENAESAGDAPVFHLTDKDKEILAMRDEDYTLHSWEDLKYLISTNALDKLTRLPSQLRKYLKWSDETKAKYGNMTNFILQNRVCWAESVDPLSLAAGDPRFTDVRSPIPFKEQADYRILVNDWPYGLGEGIVHICVWLKVRLPVDNTVGDLTPEGRRMVEDFVNETFVKGLDVEGNDQVIWFKNWVGLQSVRGLEHVHVLVRDVPKEKLDMIVERPWEGS